MMIRGLLLALTLIPTGVSAQQGFSCSYGDRGACLGFGDTVCSSSGMCVDQNAACFDKYQCDYEGFTCKSNVTECAAAYDKLLGENNTLVDEYNGLLNKHKELATEFDETITAARALKSDHDRLVSTLADMETCLLYASTLDDAKLCAP